MIKSLLFSLFIVPLFSIAQVSVVDLDKKPSPQPITRDAEVDIWNNGQNAYKGLSDKAKEVVYWTNYARFHPKRFWDSVIAPVLESFPTLHGPEARSLQQELMSAGSLPMFSLNTTLINTAQAHANDIARKQAPISHNSTNGTDFGTRLRKAGIQHCASENLSLGSDIVLSVVLLYLDIGLSDAGHRKTLLNANLLEMGVGLAKYGKEEVFIVEDFACSQQ